jgi:hypothetical protein
MSFIFTYKQENGNVVRESDKREEIYFEKGQTRQLVEQWKIKQISPERDQLDGQVGRDSEIVQQGIQLFSYILIQKY